MRLSYGGSGRFFKLALKPGLKMSLTFINMYLKWLSMNVRNSTFSGVFASIKWTSTRCMKLLKYGIRCSITPKTPHKMEGICPNVPLTELSKTQHRYYPSGMLLSLKNHFQHVQLVGNWNVNEKKFQIRFSSRYSWNPWYLYRSFTRIYHLFWSAVGIVSINRIYDFEITPRVNTQVLTKVRSAFQERSF